jgi:hypothetical protein
MINPEQDIGQEIALRLREFIRSNIPAADIHNLNLVARLPAARASESRQRLPE